MCWLVERYVSEKVVEKKKNALDLSVSKDS